MISKYVWRGIWLLLIAVVLAATLVNAESTPYPDQQILLPISNDIKVIKIEPSKSEYELKVIKWVDRLAARENCGKGIIDTNGLRSKGDMCFQDRTYASYSKKHGVYDQRKLAVAMIMDDWNNYKHWLCTVTPHPSKCPKWTLGKGIGLPPRP